jgi:DNA-binding FadR family transcriptional regulator
MHETEDLEAFAALDTRFHHAILEAGGNQLFTLVYDALEEPIRRLIASSLNEGFARKRPEALRQHSHILELIQQKNSREAARAVREHFRQTCFPKLDDSERRTLESFIGAMS